MNDDIISIAFNCLSFSKECTLEAKQHVAKLISIIFKFPQVQKKLMESADLETEDGDVSDVKIVRGICDLLEQVNHMDIIRYTIKSCTYISMNYKFIKDARFSKDILKQMMKLLDQMTGRNDKYNIILTIKNILKGDKVNKDYFLMNGGTKMFMDIILESNDFQMIEMCVQGIMEQARYKKFMIKVIGNKELLGQLKTVIKKALDITEDWMHDVNQRDFEKEKKRIVNGKSIEL